MCVLQVGLIPNLVNVATSCSTCGAATGRQLQALSNRHIRHIHRIQPNSYSEAFMKILRSIPTHGDSRYMGTAKASSITTTSSRAIAADSSLAA